MPNEPRSGPLQGLTVVEAGSMISGPTVGRLLGDFGARVIKVEHPRNGDPLRQFGPQKDGTGLWWKYLGRNRESVTLDLSHEDGTVVFEDLVAYADVLVENFRPGTFERWGLGYDRLSEINPGLVMLRISGYGQNGPSAEQPGFGTLAEAMSGFAYINGYPDSEPLLPPNPLADQITGLFGTFAVMFAVYHRDVNGGDGQLIDNSLIEPLFSLLGPQPTQYEELDEIQGRTGNSSNASAPRNVYETADGRYVALSASTQPLAMRVLEAVGRGDLQDDPRFVDNASRVEHSDELDEIIGSWIAEHTRTEVLETFDAHDATIGPVYNIEDILTDDQYRARDAVVSITDPDLGETKIQNTFPTFSETPGRIRHLGPPLGEHNDAVYREFLGYDDALIAELEAEGMI